MEEVTTNSVPSIPSEMITYKSNRYHGLVDIPITEQISEALINVFNYFDIYGPKVPVLYSVVTWIRLFQLIGGAIMVSSGYIFDSTTLTYKALSIISVLFHLVPSEYRVGNETTILTVFIAIMIIFGIYLLVTAFIFQKTSKVPQISLKVLPIFMVIGPFLFLTLIAQYTGQLISYLIVDVKKPTVGSIIVVVLSFIITLSYIWMLIISYSGTLTFRSTSLGTIEGVPQNHLLVCTLIITFVTALTSYWTQIPTTVCLIIAMICYIITCMTCFNCGTFIEAKHQTMVLGGSILGFIICAMNFYPAWSSYEWSPIFFVIVIAIAIVVFTCTKFFIEWRQRNDLIILDQFQELNDITVTKSPKKFRRIVGSGYYFTHPTCVDFSCFKAAVEAWPESLEIWIEYAKFTAIYPENTKNLEFIAQNIDLLNNDTSATKAILANIQTIIQTRETNLSFGLKNKLAKISKCFNKTKNRIRNIWDLVLQGSIDEMINAIRSSQIAIKEAEVEMNQLIMSYPNNKYVYRKLAQFYKELKADNISYRNAIEDVKKLQRGLRVNQDVIHDLGIMNFPNLPEVAESESIRYGNVIEGESFNIDDATIEDDSLLESTEVITRQIDHHKIPAIQYMYTTTSILYICLIFIPLVLIIVLYRLYIQRMTEPLDMMYGISFMRNLINMMPAFVGKYLFEKLPNSNGSGSLMRESLFTASSSLAYGGYNNTADVMNYLVSLVATASQMMSGIRSYKFGNKRMEAVRDNLFSTNVNYSLYLDYENTTVTTSSVVDIAFMVSQHVGKVASKETITAEDTYGSDVMTSRNNAITCTKHLSESLTSFILLIQDMDQQNLSMVFILMIILFLTNLFAYAITFNIQYDKLKRNKDEILNILTTLPKKVISSVSSSLNCVKNTESMSISFSVTQMSDSDMSRQEEGIIKLFTSISDSASSSSSESSNLIFMTIITIGGCIGYNLTLISYIKASTMYVNNCNHFDSLFGAISYMFAAFSELFKILLKFEDQIYSNSLPNFTASVIELEKSIYKQKDSFSNLRFGGNKTTEIPYSDLENSLKESSKLSYVCKNATIPPKTYLESARCFNTESQIYLTMSLLSGYFVDLSNRTTYPKPKEETLTTVNDMWSIGPINLYIAFFYPTGNAMKSVFESEFDQIYKQIKIVGISVLVITFILTLVILNSIRNEEKLLKGILHLLLYCPPNVILKNQCIMNLISGKYSTKSDEDIIRLNKFNGKVVNKLNDVVIVCHDDDNTVIGVNKAFKQMFGLTQSEMVNTNIKDFFQKDCFESESRIEAIVNSTTNVVYTRQDNNKVYLQFTASHTGEIKIISGRDMTQNILHERLIADEKKKSDKMLASILPPMLVPRVQAGEKNISFSVQSATVLFLDVVEFTPWCGSHDAQYVMRMLNIMFKEFDAITNAHKTMTKIKCIGDCYMAAGGIFDEVNQPAIHAKEVVDFGCLVIKKLYEIDEKENEKLRIRVGVNTGGPIVAGVIGTEKPTFEILGPAINTAHEMESHGVPMKVHISRPVYELIYGQQFNIIERGEIEVKKGKMFTYIVEP